VHVPEEDPEPSSDPPISQRRSKRVKVKPLRFWLSENIVYGMDDDGSRSFGFVQQADGTPRKK
jgi:hypothetical protein